MGNVIEELIPHREPFLFVDQLIDVTTAEIVAVKTFTDRENPVLKGSFPGQGIIPSTILIESMAQCGGAGVRQLGIAEGVFALAHIASAEFFKNVHYDEKVMYIIKNIRLSAKIVKQHGKAFVNNDLVMEASWMSVKIDPSMIGSDK
jgi:3-hydroxyacyl-[acyl-carrier-protein] dehydratase